MIEKDFINNIKKGDIIKHRNGNYSYVNDNIMSMLKDEYDDRFHEWNDRLDILQVYKVSEVIDYRDNRGKNR